MTPVCIPVTAILPFGDSKISLLTLAPVFAACAVDRLPAELLSRPCESVAQGAMSSKMNIEIRVRGLLITSSKGFVTSRRSITELKRRRSLAQEAGTTYRNQDDPNSGRLEVNLSRPR